MVFASAITVLPHIQSGKLRAIAVTSSARYDRLPDVPTIAETFPGFDMSSWLAFFAPAGLPGAIQSRLADEIVRALADQDNRGRLGAGGLIVVASSSAELAARVQTDFEARGRLIKEAGIQAQ
jgi:tripartite-type tricarboxylate transporter receptor subunit TctC